MFDFTIYNESANSKGILVTQRPSIPAPKRRINTYEVPGMNGVLTTDENTFEPIEIPINCNFMAEPDKITKKWREVKSFLLQGGITELFFSDDEEAFYRVQSVNLSNESRTSKQIISFAVNCQCSPFTYLSSGKNEVPLPAQIENSFYQAEPIYKFFGEGIFKLSVNSNDFQINVAQNATIDIEKKLVFRDDGILVNQNSSGDMAGLILNHGVNNIEVTVPDGGSALIIPCWRSL